MANKATKDAAKPTFGKQGVSISDLSTVLGATNYSVVDGSLDAYPKVEPRLPPIRIRGRILYLGTTDRKNISFLVEKDDAAKIKEALETSVKPVIIDAVKKASEAEGTGVTAPAAKKRRTLLPLETDSATDPSFNISITDDLIDSTKSRLFLKYSLANLRAAEKKTDKTIKTISAEKLQTTAFSEQDGHPLRYREAYAVFSPSFYLNKDKTAVSLNFFVNSILIGTEEPELQAEFAQKYQVRRSDESSEDVTSEKDVFVWGDEVLTATSS
jgi:hypothetical protein